ncbi:hypothetical protein ACLOJK_007540 [Asimina triloba]
MFEEIEAYTIYLEIEKPELETQNADKLVSSSSSPNPSPSKPTPPSPFKQLSFNLSKKKAP